jgi:RNA polymerase sigma factor (sigma-70 family)
VERHSHLPRALCRKWFADQPPHVRDDLISVGNEALLRAARTHDPDSGAAFTTYAANGIRWAMLTYLRDAKKEREREGVSLDAADGTVGDAAEPDALTLAEKMADPDLDPEEALLRRLDTAALWSAVDALKPEWAEMLRRFYGDCLTLEEITAAYRLPMGTVKTRLHRAKAALRDTMQRN